MPSVKKGETEAEYVKRCVPYVINKEGLKTQHALGKCYGIYKSHKKKGSKK